MLDKLTSRDFRSLVDRDLPVDLPERSGLSFRVVEVRDLEPSSPRAPRQHPFTVVFRGPADLPLPQRIYRLHHPRLGPLELFLVPIGADAEGRSYEAVFN